MPTYELKCNRCEHKFESVHGFNDPHPPCPECKSKKVKQDFRTPPPFHARLSPLHPRVNRGRGY